MNAQINQTMKSVLSKQRERLDIVEINIQPSLNPNCYDNNLQLFPILNILVPQVGHVPWVAGLPFFIVMALASFVGFHHLFVVAKSDLVRRNANLFVIRILVFYWNLNRQFGEGDQAAAWT